ncbi:MAG TPA: hypothetical protein VIJ63_01460 [Roseiarcus sp.]
MSDGRVYGSSTERSLRMMKTAVRRHDAQSSHRKRRSQPQERAGRPARKRKIVDALSSKPPTSGAGGKLTDRGDIFSGAALTVILVAATLALLIGLERLPHGAVGRRAQEAGRLKTSSSPLASGC